MIHPRAIAYDFDQISIEDLARHRRLKCESRNQVRDGTSISSPTQEEKAGGKLMLLCELFGDSLRDSGFSEAGRTAQPAYGGTIPLIDPFCDFPDNGFPGTIYAVRYSS